MDLKRADRELHALIRSRKGRRIIAVDIDGTLAEFDQWRGYKHLGKPIKKIADKLRDEAKAGSYIIIHTVRIARPNGGILPQALRALVSWLDSNHISYSEIWVGTGKPYGDSYIDDRAINPYCRECMKRWQTQNTKRKT